MQPLLEFLELSKSFNKKKVLNKLNLSINKGEMHAIAGRSGSGKSTLLNLMLGVYTPDSGRILLKGEDITGNPSRIRNAVGITTQENSFYEELTVYENMLYYANLYNVNKKGKEMKAHLMDILASVSLENSANILCRSLSGGMKRRLDFAVSVLHEPELLILDEPTTGLDPALVEQFWNIVRNYSKKGMTIVVVSHILHELEQHCSKVSILHNGKIAKTIALSPRIKLQREFLSVTK